LRWQKPENWQEQQGKTMRVASFLVTGSDGRQADMAVTTFPGDVGGDFANINRWRGQIQLPAISESELPTTITTIALPAGNFQLVDLTSTEPLIEGKYKARILGAWLKQADRTWFFKLAGDDELVGSQRETFLAFIRSIEIAAPGAQAEPVSTNNLPAPSMASTPVPPPPASDIGMAWSAPSSWTPKPLGQMRKGSFALRDSAGAEADLSITMLSAATNPLLENINRWRRQISLAPLTEAVIPAETTVLENGDLKFTVMDYLGAPPGGGAPVRLLGAILYRGDEAWFFKLTGPDALVTAQKPSFLDFLKTVNAR
jgi:hypothetical protein